MSIFVLNQNTQRETGRKAQIANVQASKAVADLIISTLGPKSMLKMLLDPMGGIVLSNDGHAILREIDIKHPAAKSMLEISRAQDEEIGDGTTSVIIIAGEMMGEALPFIQKNIHPNTIIQAYYKALDASLDIVKDLGFFINPDNDEEMKNALQCCIGTKFASRWNDLIMKLAIKSCRIISKGSDVSKLNVDIKRYAKVEKIAGGLFEDSCVLDGVMVNKDITHSDMRRKIINPRIILLDCTLEYKKGESVTQMEFTKEEHMSEALKQEQIEVMRLCNAIMKLKPDIVITEKGVSDLAQHYLLKQNIAVIRRVRKTDNNRIARCSGATIVNRPEELQETDVGTDCGLFEIKKIGDEYFSFFVESKKQSACTILLRGASKDVLNEIERNFQDALQVCRNIYQNPRLVVGGGAFEMELAHKLRERAKTISGLEQLPFKAVATAFEVIPRALAQNCGANVVKVLTELRSKHASEDGVNFGINGNTGVVEDMKKLNIIEPLVVKEHIIKVAFEASIMLLKIDDVVSGFTKKKEQKSGLSKAQPQEGQEGQDPETFGDNRDG